jgi:hypothetical protein
MYVNAFWFGVIITILVEIAALFGVAVWAAWRKIKRD